MRPYFDAKNLNKEFLHHHTLEPAFPCVVVIQEHKSLMLVKSLFTKNTHIFTLFNGYIWSILSAPNFEVLKNAETLMIYEDTSFNQIYSVSNIH